MSDVTAQPSDAVARLADTLRSTRAQLARRSAHDVSASLGAAGERFLDPNDPLRAEALAGLPASSGLSSAMCVAVLDGMAADWTTDRLDTLVAAELGGPAALDGFVTTGRRRSMAVGPALAVQVVAGGVPGVAVTALLRSLVVKGPTLLRPGRGDVLLPTLFARALAAIDPALADSVAVVTWPSSSAAHTAAAIECADIAVVYGSDATVRAVRAVTPATTRLVEYRHRVSIGVVGRGALTPSHVDQAVADVATAVGMYDQRGCVSPQIVFVEEGGSSTAADFAERLAGAFADLEARLPSGPLDTSNASTLQQARATAELATAAKGSGFVRHGRVAPWTVVFDDGTPLALPTGGRFVRLHPIADAGEVPVILAGMGPHLQTIGITGLGSRTEGLARELGHIGASRVAPLASVAYPPAWWHHDGRGPLLDLVRWVDLEQ